MTWERSDRTRVSFGLRIALPTVLAIVLFAVAQLPPQRLQAIAAGLGTEAPISIRVNPDVDARTHEKIATGRKENKFGIPIARAREVYAHAARLPGLRGEQPT